MKFDDAINYIAESTLNAEMARHKNLAVLARAAELEKKGLSPSTAKAYAWKELRAGKLGSSSEPIAVEPAADEPSKPVAGFKRSTEALRAKEQVEDFLEFNRSATAEDVAVALDLDPELVNSVYDDAKNEIKNVKTSEPSEEPGEEEVKDLEKDKLARIRDQIMKLRGLKGKGKHKHVKAPKDIDASTDDDELSPAVDPDIQDYVGRTGGSVDQEN